MSSKEIGPPKHGFGRIFLRNQFITAPKYPPNDTNLSGKTAIITGANVGLGLESARQLLDLALTHLIIAVRSIDKGEHAASQLRKAHPKATIDVWPLDMLSYDSVQAFAARADRELTHLDIAILNAGVANTAFRAASTTGHEEITQVNYLSTVLLATLLLPIAKAKKPPSASRPPIITLVSSGLALAATFKNRAADPLLPSFSNPANFHPTDTYSTSKTLGHLWLWRAADYVSPDDVVLSAVDPGYIRGTALHRDYAAPLQPVMWLFSRVLGKSVRVGASTYVDAVIGKGRESHGSFLLGWEVMSFNEMLYTPEGQEVAERLWRETMAELSFADVEGILKGMKKDGEVTTKRQ